MSCLLIAVLCAGIPARADKLTVGGFVRTDAVFDSRQSQQSAEGLYTYYPLPYVADADGKDINKTPNGGIISLTTRFFTTYTADDKLWGASLRAYVEADFGSNFSGNGAVVRMRHAYMEMNWENSSLLIGQTWHPLSASIIPVTLDLNTGSPIRPFNRSPQVRFRQQLASSDAVSVSLAAVYQQCYISSGPDGPSSKYQHQAAQPDFVIGLQIKPSGTFSMGLDAETKAVKPRLYTVGSDNLKRKTDEMLRSYTGQAWLQYVSDKFTLKAASLYTQNMHDTQLIGGYAVSKTDATTGRETYTSTQHMNYWLMLQYGKQIQYGLYTGYVKSLGTVDEVADVSKFYGRACDMDWMFRVAPRVYYRKGSLQLAGEVEISTASFGTLVPNTCGDIINTKTVTGVKVDLAASVFF